MNVSTVPLQKSTMVYPDLASSVTMATKLFSCCVFLMVRIFDIFPEKKKKKAQDLIASEYKMKSNRFFEFFHVKNPIEG